RRCCQQSLPPLPQASRPLGAELLGFGTVRNSRPAVSWEQEVVYLVRRQRFGERTVNGRLNLAPSYLGPGSCFELLGPPGGSAAANEAVAAPKLQTEPRRLQPRMHAVQPKGDLGQL